MIVAKDPAHAARARLLRQHAMSVPDTVRHHSDRVVFEEYTEPAFNYRLTDLQAAVGRPQLARLGEIVAERRRLADRYAAALKDNPMFAPPVERAGRRSSWQSYAVSLRPGAKLTQVEAMQALVDRGIACRRGIHNAHQEPAYAGRDNWTRAPGETLAVSERIRDTRILIPLFHGMSVEEQDLVIETLNAVAALAK